MKPTQSPSGKLSIDDIKKFGMDMLKYTSPLLVIFLTAISQGVPLKQAMYLVYAALIQLLINLFSKFQAGK